MSPSSPLSGRSPRGAPPPPANPPLLCRAPGSDELVGSALGEQDTPQSCRSEVLENSSWRSVRHRNSRSADGDHRLEVIRYSSPGLQSAVLEGRLPCGCLLGRSASLSRKVTHERILEACRRESLEHRHTLPVLICLVTIAVIT